jgi:3-hydroxyisobutyrate dehydrogenase
MTNTTLNTHANPLTVAFIGLGVMGYPMAGHLSKKGFATRVFNRNAEKSAAWVKQYAGTAHATPREAAQGADVICICVGNDDDLRSVVLGEHGVLAGARRGAVIVDHTTASATVAKDLHAIAAAQGIGFVDAPVSGGQAGAVNGALTVMCGGSVADFALAQPVAMAYAKACTHLGDVGMGQMAKMVNQICIAGLVQGLSEAVAFGQKAGLDMHAVLDTIGKGAAQSWQMDNRGKTMVQGEFNFGFAVDWMRKDLGLVLDQARVLGARVPVTALVDQFYADVQAMGGQRWDTSSLIKRLA